MTDSIDRLYQSILAARSDDPATSRTARLFQSGRSKMVKKLVEEAIEVGIDALEENREAVIKESADLVYNMVVVWASTGIEPREVWAEMRQREQLFGIAEKLPKVGAKQLAKISEQAAEPPARRKVVTLEARRARKSR